MKKWFYLGDKQNNPFFKFFSRQFHSKEHFTDEGNQSVSNIVTIKNITSKLQIYRRIYRNPHEMYMEIYNDYVNKGECCNSQCIDQAWDQSEVKDQKTKILHNTIENTVLDQNQFNSFVNSHSEQNTCNSIENSGSEQRNNDITNKSGQCNENPPENQDVTELHQLPLFPPKTCRACFQNQDHMMPCCDFCENWWHIKCEDISEYDYKHIIPKLPQYQCKTCRLEEEIIDIWKYSVFESDKILLELLTDEKFRGGDSKKKLNKKPLNYKRKKSIKNENKIHNPLETPPQKSFADIKCDYSQQEGIFRTANEPKEEHKNRNSSIEQNPLTDPDVISVEKQTGLEQQTGSNNPNPTQKRQQSTEKTEQKIVARQKPVVDKEENAKRTKRKTTNQNKVADFVSNQKDKVNSNEIKKLQKYKAVKNDQCPDKEEEISNGDTQKKVEISDMNQSNKENPGQKTVKQSKKTVSYQDLLRNWGQNTPNQVTNSHSDQDTGQILKQSSFVQTKKTSQGQSNEEKKRQNKPNLAKEIVSFGSDQESEEEQAKNKPRRGRKPKQHTDNKEKHNHKGVKQVIVPMANQDLVGNLTQVKSKESQKDVETKKIHKKSSKRTKEKDYTQKNKKPSKLYTEKQLFEDKSDPNTVKYQNPKFTSQEGGPTPTPYDYFHNAAANINTSLSVNGELFLLNNEKKAASTKKSVPKKFIPQYRYDKEAEQVLQIIPQKGGLQELPGYISETEQPITNGTMVSNAAKNLSMPHSFEENNKRIRTKEPSKTRNLFNKLHKNDNFDIIEETHLSQTPGLFQEPHSIETTDDLGSINIDKESESHIGHSTDRTQFSNNVSHTFSCSETCYESNSFFEETQKIKHSPDASMELVSLKNDTEKNQNTKNIEPRSKIGTNQRMKGMVYHEKNEERTPSELTEETKIIEQENHPSIFGTNKHATISNKSKRARKKVTRGYSELKNSQMKDALSEIFTENNTPNVIKDSAHSVIESNPHLFNLTKLNHKILYHPSYNGYTVKRKPQKHHKSIYEGHNKKKSKNEMDALGSENSPNVNKLQTKELVTGQSLDSTAYKPQDLHNLGPFILKDKPKQESFNSIDPLGFQDKSETCEKLHAPKSREKERVEISGLLDSKDKSETNNIFSHSEVIHNSEAVHKIELAQYGQNDTSINSTTVLSAHNSNSISYESTVQDDFKHSPGLGDTSPKANIKIGPKDENLSNKFINNQSCEPHAQNLEKQTNKQVKNHQNVFESFPHGSSITKHETPLIKHGKPDPQPSEHIKNGIPPEIKSNDAGNHIRNTADLHHLIPKDSQSQFDLSEYEPIGTLDQNTMDQGVGTYGHESEKSINLPQTKKHRTLKTEKIHGLSTKTTDRRKNKPEATLKRKKLFKKHYKNHFEALVPKNPRDKHGGISSRVGTGNTDSKLEQKQDNFVDKLLTQVNPASSLSHPKRTSSQDKSIREQDITADIPHEDKKFDTEREQSKPHISDAKHRIKKYEPIVTSDENEQLPKSHVNISEKQLEIYKGADSRFNKNPDRQYVIEPTQDTQINPLNIILIREPIVASETFLTIPVSGSQPIHNTPTSKAPSNKNKEVTSASELEESIGNNMNPRKDPLTNQRSYPDQVASQLFHEDLIPKSIEPKQPHKSGQIIKSRESMGLVKSDQTKKTDKATTFDQPSQITDLDGQISKSEHVTVPIEPKENNNLTQPPLLHDKQSQNDQTGNTMGSPRPESIKKEDTLDFENIQMGIRPTIPENNISSNCSDTMQNINSDENVLDTLKCEQVKFSSVQRNIPVSGQSTSGSEKNLEQSKRIRTPYSSEKEDMRPEGYDKNSVVAEIKFDKDINNYRSAHCINSPKIPEANMSKDISTLYTKSAEVARNKDIPGLNFKTKKVSGPPISDIKVTKQNSNDRNITQKEDAPKPDSMMKDTTENKQTLLQYTTTQKHCTPDQIKKKDRTPNDVINEKTPTLQPVKLKKGDFIKNKLILESGLSEEISTEQEDIIDDKSENEDLKTKKEYASKKKLDVSEGPQNVSSRKKKDGLESNLKRHGTSKTSDIKKDKRTQMNEKKNKKSEKKKEKGTKTSKFEKYMIKNDTVEEQIRDEKHSIVNKRLQRLFIPNEMYFAVKQYVLMENSMKIINIKTQGEGTTTINKTHKNERFRNKNQISTNPNSEQYHKEREYTNWLSKQSICAMCKSLGAVIEVQDCDDTAIICSYCHAETFPDYDHPIVGENCGITNGEFFWINQNWWGRSILLRGVNDNLIGFNNNNGKDMVPSRHKKSKSFVSSIDNVDDAHECSDSLSSYGLSEITDDKHDTPCFLLERRGNYLFVNNKIISYTRLIFLFERLRDSSSQEIDRSYYNRLLCECKSLKDLFNLENGCYKEVIRGISNNGLFNESINRTHEQYYHILTDNTTKHVGTTGYDMNHASRHSDSKTCKRDIWNGWNKLSIEERTVYLGEIRESLTLRDTIISESVYDSRKEIDGGRYDKATEAISGIKHISYVETGSLADIQGDTNESIDRGTDSNTNTSVFIKKIANTSLARNDMENVSYTNTDTGHDENFNFKTVQTDNKVKSTAVSTKTVLHEEGCVTNQALIDNHTLTHILTVKNNPIVSCSYIAGKGLFSDRMYENNEPILFYEGNIVSKYRGNIMDTVYERNGLFYCFKLSDKWMIDSTIIGNKCKLINHGCNKRSSGTSKPAESDHSVNLNKNTQDNLHNQHTFDHDASTQTTIWNRTCLANCTSSHVLVGGMRKVLVWANRIITGGEELTYDYGRSRTFDCGCENE